MKGISLDFLITYISYMFFLYYPTKWMKDFRGASHKIYLFLIYFSGIGTFLKIAILGLIWHQIDFQNAFGIFFISILTTTILTTIEFLITRKIFNVDYPIQYIGLVSLIVCPILVVRLFYLLKIF